MKRFIVFCTLVLPMLVVAPVPALAGCSDDDPDGSMTAAARASAQPPKLAPPPQAAARFS